MEFIPIILLQLGNIVINIISPVMPLVYLGIYVLVSMAANLFSF